MTRCLTWMTIQSSTSRRKMLIMPTSWMRRKKRSRSFCPLAGIHVSCQHQWFNSGRPLLIRLCQPADTYYFLEILDDFPPVTTRSTTTLAEIVCATLDDNQKNDEILEHSSFAFSVYDFSTFFVNSLNILTLWRHFVVHNRFRRFGGI